MKNIVCFGEVLWDVFPNNKRIGGAPLNVAIRLQSLNNNVSIITRIGDDADGKNITRQIKELGVGIDNIQTDAILKTGEVTVEICNKGTASYDVNYPRAWDAIKVTKEAKKVTRNSDVFVFGSLIARNEVSRETLYELLKLASYKFFDVNLREPYYTNEILIYLMNQANFIKFNTEEFFDVATVLNSNLKSIEQNIKFIAAKTNTKSICVTRGRGGAVLYYNNTFYYNYGYEVTVKDTVGAGDSFLASLIDKLLKGTSPQKALDFATAVGALFVSNEGANPEITKNDINKLLSGN